MCLLCLSALTRLGVLGCWVLSWRLTKPQLYHSIRILRSGCFDSNVWRVCIVPKQSLLDLGCFYCNAQFQTLEWEWWVCSAVLFIFSVFVIAFGIAIGIGCETALECVCVCNRLSNFNWDCWLNCVWNSCSAMFRKVLPLQLELSFESPLGLCLNLLVELSSSMSVGIALELFRGIVFGIAFGLAVGNQMQRLWSRLCNWFLNRRWDRLLAFGIAFGIVFGISFWSLFWDCLWNYLRDCFWRCFLE